MLGFPARGEVTKGLEVSRNTMSRHIQYSQNLRHATLQVRLVAGSLDRTFSSLGD